VTVEAGTSNDSLDVLRALYAPLRRYAAVVGSYDVEPDDLVQEAFTRFLSQPIEEIEHPQAYLRRTILNVALNERRRQQRAVAALSRQRAGDGPGAADSYPSELTDLLRIEPRVRGLLYLVEVEGEPVGDAAAAVGMSPAAARMALSRARRRLRDALFEESSDD
jgi:RNA polymerase sigma-70 factor (ECF subfamily)